MDAVGQDGFLKDIPIESDRFVRFATAVSGAFGSTSAWVFPPSEIWSHHGVAGTKPQLWFGNTVYLTSENAYWLPRFLAEMSILQPIDARMAASMPKTLGGGVPNVSGPALLGRSKQSDVLDETMATYCLRGNSPNRWIGTTEFEKMAAHWNKSDGCVCRGSRDEFTLEADIGGQPALIKLSTNQKHPKLGNGLRCDLMTPIFGNKKSIAERCAALNLAETMWTSIPQFGCWSPLDLGDDEACAKFTSFIPNKLYGNGIASLTVSWFFERLLWVFGKYPT